MLSYQALAEFVAAATRPLADGRSLLSADEAHHEADEMMAQFPVIYPTDNTLRIALRGAALYKLSWTNALTWAYADERELGSMWTEDFDDNRLYGKVRALNPFLLPIQTFSWNWR